MSHTKKRQLSEHYALYNITAFQKKKTCYKAQFQKKPNFFPQISFGYY